MNPDKISIILPVSFIADLTRRLRLVRKHLRDIHNPSVVSDQRQHLEEWFEILLPYLSPETQVGVRDALINED